MIDSQLYFFKLIYFNWRLITLQYCSGFFHTLTWVSHRCTCVPHPEPSSHLPTHPIPQGHPSAPALSTLSHASNMDQWSASHMIIYTFLLYLSVPKYSFPTILLLTFQTSFLLETFFMMLISHNLYSKSSFCNFKLHAVLGLYIYLLFHGTWTQPQLRLGLEPTDWDLNLPAPQIMGFKCTLFLFFFFFLIKKIHLMSGLTEARVLLSYHRNTWIWKKQKMKSEFVSIGYLWEIQLSLQGSPASLRIEGHIFNNQKKNGEGRRPPSSTLFSRCQSLCH